MYSLLIELDAPDGEILERLREHGAKVDPSFEPVTVSSRNGSEHVVLLCEFEEFPRVEALEAIPGVASVFSNPQIAPMGLE